MRIRLLAIAALMLGMLCAPVRADYGPYGLVGNDTGGIIPWSPDNERMAFQLAQENCGYYNKYAVPTSIHRVPGDFIAYKCVWESPDHQKRYR
jgi:hypothetical protein